MQSLDFWGLADSTISVSATHWAGPWVKLAEPRVITRHTDICFEPDSLNLKTSQIIAAKLGQNKTKNFQIKNNLGVKDIYNLPVKAKV